MEKRLTYRWALAIAVLSLVALQWCSDEVRTRQLVFEVGPLKELHFLENRYHYLLLLAGTLVFPLAWSFDARIDYYKKWPAVFRAIWPIAVLFIAWDVVFTWRGVWGFNEHYLSGWSWCGLPWEEWAFFVVIPFSCLFIYEALIYFFPRFTLEHFEPALTRSAALVLLAIGLSHWSRTYTFTTFVLAGCFTAYHGWSTQPAPWRSHFYLTWLVSFIPFLFVNGALTGAFTQQPVVVYNPEEFLGIRLGTIPLDDAFYSYLLLFSITTLYEGYKNQ